MRTVLLGMILYHALASGLEAAPIIGNNGIVNAASNKPVGAPGSAVARGGLISIYGTGLGPAAGVSATSFPLQRTLAGVSLQAIGTSGSANPIPLFVSAGQINAILPSNTPLGQVNVTVTYNGETSRPAAVQVTNTSFGLITRTGSGGGPAVVQNFVSETELPLNALSNSARPGQVLIAYGTGLGPITAPEDLAPPAADFNAVPVQILVGGRTARRLYAGRSTCCAGLDQINFEVPADAPAGCYVPLTIKAGDFLSNTASISVTPGGGACSDQANPLASLVAGSGSKSIGLISMFRTTVAASVLGQTLEISQDSASALFARTDETSVNGVISLPPVGACSNAVTPARNNPISFSTNTPSAPPTPLDAGASLQITGPNGSRSVPRQSLGNYFATLGSTPIPNQPPAPPLFLDPGNYTLSGPGGADIGSFTTSVALAGPLTWTNRDQISAVDLSQGVTVTWSGGDPSREVALIIGTSTDAGALATGQFICIAPLGSGTFTVSSSVLGSLPPSGSQSGLPNGLLVVGKALALNAPTFSAPRLDMGIFYTLSLTGKLLAFR